MIECNADLDHPCDADRTNAVDEDDEGEPCPSCKEWEASFRREYDRTPASVRRLDTMSKEELDQELVDAGRGHLVRP